MKLRRAMMKAKASGEGKPAGGARKEGEPLGLPGHFGNVDLSKAKKVGAGLEAGGGREPRGVLGKAYRKARASGSWKKRKEGAGLWARKKAAQSNLGNV